MAGFNGQEGGIYFAKLVTPVATRFNISVSNGVSRELLEGVLLPAYCRDITPLSAQLCVDFLTRRYDLADTADDKERAIRLTTMLG